MRLPSKIVIGVGATLFAFLVLGVASRWRSRSVLRFPYIGKPLSQADYDRMAHMPGWVGVPFRTPDGVVLRGLEKQPPSGGPWVIFFNGNSPQMLSEGQAFIEALSKDSNIGGAVWAYRGFDGSQGKPGPDALVDDAWGAYLSLLQRHELKPQALHIVGFSLGTNLAAAVAARAGERAPASLTLMAPMTELNMGERSQLFLDRYQTLQYLNAIQSPTLVIHGLEDRTLPIEHGRAIAGALAARGRLLEVPGLAHYELPLSAPALSAVRAFVREHTR